MSAIEKPLGWLPRTPVFIGGGLGVLLLSWLAGSHYRIFRASLEELILLCFILVWILAGQTYHYFKDEFLLFIGYLFLIGAFFSGAYLWTCYFLGSPAAAAGQGEAFWMAGRYLQGAGLCLAPFAVKSKLRRRLFLGLLSLAAILMTILIINADWGRISVKAAPLWKTVSQALLLFFYGGALFTHWLRRKMLQRPLALTLLTATSLLVVAGVGLLLESGSYQLVTTMGHLLRLGAYGLILHGMLLVSIKIPYEVIFKELKDSATQDELTGLLNRKGLNDFVTKELAANQDVKPVGILLMDLDGFKAINDHYGHTRGDYLLVEFAKILKSCVRGTDLLCRYGGDEFLVLVKAGQSELNMVRSRIQEAVADWRAHDNLARQIGVSIGSAVWDLNLTRDLQQVLMEADQDMYWEKKKRKLLEKSGKK